MGEKKVRRRDDIVLLRGLAVLLVCLNHNLFPGFGFGFIGVDIFFVISGYLITSMLLREYLFSESHEKGIRGSIALVNFYAKRIRRLMPAALVVLFAVNVIAYLILNSSASDKVLNESKWAIFLMANVYFLRSSSDYFSLSADPSLLQHYWSLSVEEQFYFIWPFFFMLAATFHRFRIKDKFIRFHVRLVSMLLVVSISSLVILQISFHLNPTQTYFSSFGRFWEVGIGGIFGVLAHTRKSLKQYSTFEKSIPLVGALIISAFFLNSTNWGILIIVPVLATGLFLYLGQHEIQSKPDISVIVKFAKSVFRFLGRISYSLYLVHWPVTILAKHFDFLDSLIQKFCVLAISIFVANLLWRYVENPFQRISVKKFAWDKSLFNSLITKKSRLFAILLCLVIPLTLVTYPSSTRLFVAKQSSTASLSTDPELLNFSEYQLDSPETLSKDSICDTLDAGDSGVTSLSLSRLVEKQKCLLTESLTQSQLTAEGRVHFARSVTDISRFESLGCADQDTVRPPDCEIQRMNSREKHVVLVGDSKMSQFAQSFIDYFDSDGWKVSAFNMNGCNFLSPRNNLKRNCVSRTQWVTNEVSKNRFDLVIVAVYPAQRDADALSRLVKITESAKKTILLGSFPKTQNPTDCIRVDYTYNIDCSYVDKSETRAFLNEKQFYNGLISDKIKFIDASKWSCLDTVCPISVRDVVQTRDGIHLTYTFVRSIAQIIRLTIDESLE